MPTGTYGNYFGGRLSWQRYKIERQLGGKDFTSFIRKVYKYMSRLTLEQRKPRVTHVLRFIHSIAKKKRNGVVGEASEEFINFQGFNMTSWMHEPGEGKV
jgi:hypothetical protein